MGCFLDPPGSPQYDYEVREGRSTGFYSLEAALEYGLPGVQDRIRALYRAAPIRCTEDWLADVYRYFRHCYSPDGVSCNVSDCIIDRENARSPETHLAVLFVRKWFPCHAPRLDRIG
jgi:hypothetical protein